MCECGQKYAEKTTKGWCAEGENPVDNLAQLLQSQVLKHNLNFEVRGTKQLYLNE